MLGSGTWCSIVLCGSALTVLLVQRGLESGVVIDFAWLGFAWLCFACIFFPSLSSSLFRL